jgi:ABC-2 type transport system permease protein
MTLATNDTVLLWMAEIQRALIDLRRYWTETALGLLIHTAIFLGILHGINVVGGGAPGSSTVDSLVAGFFVWSLASTAYGGLANEISRECTLGTIEQLVIAPPSLAGVFAVRAGVQLAIGLVTSVLILLVTMALTGRWVSFDASAALALGCGLPAVMGLGLMLGALALLLKRVIGFMVVTHAFLVFAIGLGAEPFTAAGALPFAAAATVTLDRAVRHMPVNPADLLFVIANSVIYVGLGLAVFAAAERRARRNNTLEHH